MTSSSGVTALLRPRPLHFRGL